MPRRVYVGPIQEVVTQLDDVEMVVARGDVIDVSAAQAAVLDLTPENWATPPSRKQKDGDD